MPRVKYLGTKAGRIAEATRSCEAVGRVLKGYANAPQIHKSDLVKLQESTARKRLEHPEKLTIEELIQIGIAFDIPCEAIMAKISW